MEHPPHHPPHLPPLLPLPQHSLRHQGSLLAERTRRPFPLSLMEGQLVDGNLLTQKVQCQQLVPSAGGPLKESLEGGMHLPPPLQE